MDTFQVAVRVRPLNNKELNQSSKEIIQVPNNHQLVFDPLTQEAQSGHMRQKNLTFNYDYVYQEKQTNKQIYDEAVTPLMKKLFEGFNVTIFAYGATSSGKTFTIQGDSEHQGILQQSLQLIFEKMTQEDQCFISYMEIYNEQINDLINVKNQNLQLRDDINSVIIQNLSQIQTYSYQEAITTINRSLASRQTFATNENAQSSRSHSILQLQITTKINTSKFLLIDLAGSERLQRTQAQGQRLQEGCSINKSLLALGNCLSALCRSNNYVPYRNSKLTRILKETLSGQSKVLMLCNISPSGVCYEDTLNSLTYAQRATYIKCQSKINIQTIQYNQTELQQLIQQLKEENLSLQKELDLSKQQQSINPVQNNSIDQELETSAKNLLQQSQLHFNTQVERKLIDFKLQLYQQIQKYSNSNQENTQKLKAKQSQLKEIENATLQEINQLKTQIQKNSNETKTFVDFQKNLNLQLQCLQQNTLNTFRNQVIAIYQGFFESFVQQMPVLTELKEICQVVVQDQQQYHQIDHLLINFQKNCLKTDLFDSQAKYIDIKQTSNEMTACVLAESLRTQDLNLSGMTQNDITLDNMRTITINKPLRKLSLEKWNTTQSMRRIPGLHPQQNTIQLDQYNKELQELQNQLGSMNGSVLGRRSVIK